MNQLNLYWAEEALNEPYPVPDFRAMKSAHRLGLMLGGATSALTAAALVGLVVHQSIDRSHHVSIASYELEKAKSISSLLPKKLLAAAPAPTADAHINEEMPTTETLTLTPRKTADHPVEVKTPDPKPSITAQKLVSRTQTAQSRLPVEPATKLALKPVKLSDTAVTPATAGPFNKPQSTTQNTTIDQVARDNPTKGTEYKPTDIASGEKLGIREILVDGIIMHNGRKIINGHELPNDEILIRTDVGKGMAETDRRVLVLTP